MTRDEELLAEIARRPNDDNVLRVYADHLEEQGDPRGELIALQLARADPARQAALIATYAQTWAAPLLPWIKLQGSTFARGFLAEVQLADLRVDFGPVIGNVMWATVRVIHLGRVRTFNRADFRGTMRQISELIGHPIMRSLQYVTESDEPLMIERQPDGGCAFVPRFG